MILASIFSFISFEVRSLTFHCFEFAHTGREASKVLRLLQSQPAKPFHERVNPEDIPGFIMNFAREVKNQEDISLDDSVKELFFLISRALLPKCSTVFISFDQLSFDLVFFSYSLTLLPCICS